MNKPTANFNANDLATVVPGLIITNTNPYRYPNVAVNTSVLAAGDKSVTTSTYFKDKKINVGAEIGQNTRELLDAAIDKLFQYLQGREKALILSWGTTTRQWTATLSNVAISDVQGGHAIIDIEFECADPFGYETSSTSLFSTSLSGASGNTPFVVPVAGSAPWQVPIITITLSALTGGTAKTVTIGNPATGQSLSITRTWTAGDVIVIDSQLKKVTVNGTEVAAVGAIPEWAPGSGGSMDYSDTLTTRTRVMSGLYYKRYA